MVSSGLAAPAVWVRNQLLDTDRFVRTVAPLAENEDIQQAVATRITTEITAAVTSADVVSESNPAIAAIVPMVTTAAVDSVTQDVVNSPEFAPLWEDVARAAHSGFQALLNGGDSPYLSTENGQVTMDLGPIAAEVNARLATRGIDVTLPTTDLTFVLFESSTLADLQEYTKMIDELAVILPVVALAALLGYLLLSVNRRGAIVVAALGLAIMMTVDLIMLALGRWLYLRDLGPTADKEAVTATLDILTHYLRAGLRIIGLGAILVAIVGYLLVRGRLSAREDEETARHSLYERWAAIGRFENAVATNRLASVVAWSAIIVAIMLLWDWQDIGWAVVAIVAGIAGAIVLLRAKPVPPELLAPRRAATAAAPEARESTTLDLQHLADLRNQGLLTDEEFARAKATVLGLA
jgi:hypothetical protein